MPYNNSLDYLEGASVFTPAEGAQSNTDRRRNGNSQQKTKLQQMLSLASSSAATAKNERTQAVEGDAERTATARLPQRVSR